MHADSRRATGDEIKSGRENRRIGITRRVDLDLSFRQSFEIPRNDARMTLVASFLLIPRFRNRVPRLGQRTYAGVVSIIIEGTLTTSPLQKHNLNELFTKSVICFVKIIMTLLRNLLAHISA